MNGKAMFDNAMDELMSFVVSIWVMVLLWSLLMNVIVVSVQAMEVIMEYMFLDELASKFCAVGVIVMTLVDLKLLQLKQLITGTLNYIDFKMNEYE